MRIAFPAATLALALAACGSDPDPAPRPPPNGWLDVPGMICADDSQTGIGISPGDPGAVLVYLSGGGACWGDTAAECDANFRSFGKLEFDLGSQLLVRGTILDRALPGNPFATWTVVFVPYCTGDVHAGDAVRTHGSLRWNHHGYRNLQAAVARMAAEVPRPSQVVVAGSSAGGFGALLAYDLVRARWPAEAGVIGALVDDSGPTLVGTDIRTDIRAAWWDAWHLGSTLGTLCETCATDLAADLSGIWPVLREKHPADRLALVSATQDATMRRFFGGMDGPVFQDALDALATKLKRLAPGAASFRVGGPRQEDHALLFSPSLASYASGDGTLLLDWLSDMAALRLWTSEDPGP